ncbi:hypothetical protein [Microbulbifer halophilus]|uniref:Uncharacterized protein n=1 Tax=Microbulbifer halophilus TaxID=453963 RepID=A0ABW5EE70_9GAMM|nr:hypothetical protein [Microbulbifer halophilus]MCW8127714.1 hypothetical protein [Microbulbifer halophilus]
MVERRRHEPDLPRVRPIARTLWLTLLLVLASGWLLWHVYRLWQPQPSPPLFAPPAPTQPQLQTNPRADLRDYREREQRRLQSYGWVNREAGVVHIPIERAMDLLVERGLPGERKQEENRQNKKDREKTPEAGEREGAP